MQVDGATSDLRCPSCGGPTVHEVSEGVQGGRLVWSEEISCRDCPHLVLACGEGDLPSSLRAKLLARYGAATVHLDPAEAGPLRVRLLSVLRASGDRSIAAAVAEYDRLTGEGVTGTAGEMRLLADRLTAAGARVYLDPPTHPERLE
ncbi:hypothetical protein [Dactylosporangium sp. NPDC049140]|uniref:hypothetical protein n=1 Tax=Dactylosporangium sp. NPDC049140 TaxID=3155647 RepID=UPI0033E36F4A